MSNSLYIKAAQVLKHDAGQWNAYESSGHCVVLAGPGSGKTKTLTIKLARLLAEDINEPRGIACITYNNECARELENRLEKLGIEPSRRVFIGTVHSFSLTQIIIPYAKTAKLGLPEDFQVASQTERMRALEQAFWRTIKRSDDPKYWDTRMGKYRRSILDRNSSEWKTNDPELADLVIAYEEELRAMRRIDFDDMPLLAVKALRENLWIQRALFAKYPVLVVDEYQDLGRALHQIVMKLCFGAGIRLFAVGDVDQSIYGFTGAHPELLKQLSERDDVKPVRLQLNYRCGTRIVAASNFILGEDRNYEAYEGAKEGTIYFHPRSGQYEHHANYLFSKLLPEIRARLPDITLEDIAILYHAAKIGDSVAEAAQNYGFSTVRTDGKSLYPRSSRLMRWLEQCAEWCCGGWQTGTPRLNRLTNDGRRLFAEMIINDDEFLAFQRELVSVLWSNRDPEITLSKWLKGLSEIIINPLIKFCRTMSDEQETLTNFIKRCETGDCNKMLLGDFCKQGEGKDSIKLSTLHSSKGREFKVAIMFGIDNNVIPRAKPSNQEIVEARRLFYVGFTRAERELHFIYSENKPSPFVEEVKNRLEPSI